MTAFTCSAKGKDVKHVLDQMHHLMAVLLYQL